MLDDDHGEDGRAIVHVIEVWECHQQAVEVFRLCPVRGIGHMGGIHWEGISPEAVAAVVLVLRPSRGAWPGLLTDVVFMGQCVARERNRLAAAKSKRGR